MNALYQLALIALRPVAELWAWSRHFRPVLDEEPDQRRGRSLPTVAAGSLWLHGASLGEARLVAAVATGWMQRPGNHPLVVTGTTPAGRTELAKLSVPSAYPPLDFPTYVRRTFDAFRPTALGLMETELWPNLLRRAEREQVPTVLLNARLSEHRMQKYRRFRGLYVPRVRALYAIAAQSSADAARFVELGATERSVHVCGNIKFDLAASSEERDAVRSSLGIGPDRLVWVAGSTREGEEPILLEAFRELRREFPELLLVLAPRHVERVGLLRRLLQDAGLEFWHESDSATIRSPGSPVMLVDRLGVLNRLYAAADLAFVGGTLAPVGGHNILEPAAAGVPVLFGPHQANVKETARLLVVCGGGATVDDAASLADRIARWLANPESRRAAGEAALEVIRSHRGALEKNLNLLQVTVDSASGQE